MYLTPQNVQTNSDNLSTFPDECLSVFDHFVGLTLKGLSNKNALETLLPFSTPLTHLVTIFFQPLTIFAKHSILDN